VLNPNNVILAKPDEPKTDIPVRGIPADRAAFLAANPVNEAPRPAQPTTIRDLDGYDVVLPEGFMLHDVYYDFDIGDFISRYSAELDVFIEVARNNPHMRFEVTSHTDERGTHAYNQELSERRLRSVMNYVTARGVDPSRIVGRAVGKTQLQYVNARNEEEHALNRRTTIRLYDPNAVAIVNNPAPAQQRGTTAAAAGAAGTTATSTQASREIDPFNQRGLVFRVQIGAATTMPRHPNYLFRDHLNAAPGTTLAHYRNPEGMFVFTLGEFEDPAQARALNQRMANIGKQTFVTAWLDGKLMLLHDGEVLFRQRNR